MTGAELLKLAGKVPPENFILTQKIRGGVIKTIISWVREPACVVRRIEPRVTEDGAVGGMDLHASLSDEFDPHREEDTPLGEISCSAA